MFYLTTHSTHFIYGYMASDHSDSEKGNPLPPHRLLFPITARVLLYALSHRQDSTYHGLCYTSRGALAGTRNSSMGPPHEGSIRRPIAPWANALTTELHHAPNRDTRQIQTANVTGYLTKHIVFIGNIIKEHFRITIPVKGCSSFI